MCFSHLAGRTAATGLMRRGTCSGTISIFISFADCKAVAYTHTYSDAHANSYPDPDTYAYAYSKTHAITHGDSGCYRDSAQP